MKRAAFSLIEVNVALLVIGGGMLSLFTLFPAGLRMSTAALSDTRQALFADNFFSYFEDGLQTIQKRADWQNVQTFWRAAQQGLLDGFGNSADIPNANDTWEADEVVCNSWDPDLKPRHFKKTRGGGGSDITLRFYEGSVKDYFSSSSDVGKLSAAFIVRIASDFAHPDRSGSPSHSLDDGLVWRVSLIVSDEGENGWFYDNPVYHRDFRYAELP